MKSETKVGMGSLVILDQARMGIAEGNRKWRDGLLRKRSVRLWVG